MSSNSSPSVSTVSADPSGSVVSEEFVFVVGCLEDTYPELIRIARRRSPVFLPWLHGYDGDVKRLHKRHNTPVVVTIRNVMTQRWTRGVAIDMNPSDGASLPIHYLIKTKQGIAYY